MPPSRLDNVNVDDVGRALIQTPDRNWLEFERPVRVLTTSQPGEVAAVIRETETLVLAHGWHAVVAVAYEAGGAWGLPVGPPVEGTPLVWFGLYSPERVTTVTSPRRDGRVLVSGLIPGNDRRQFEEAFGQVHRHLAEGDSYQVNYTFQMTGRFEGSAGSLFADLVAAQRPAAAAFIDLGRYAICSASPEIFFERQGRTLSTRPMKGTTRRGRTTGEDLVQRDALRSSPKQQAENVMIVDMMRNDLGRIDEVGTVTVPSLFDVERYPNVWQMTSSVIAHSSAGLVEIFEALHPSASVTGAPKIRTMAILRELEHQPRGIYTGAIGHVAPGGDARFNVAIRTAVVDRVEGQVRFGVGSGLVWDSNASDEYDECLLKGSILGSTVGDFDLLETLRWNPGEGFWLLDRHLDRLKDSAKYFGRRVDETAVHAALTSAVSVATVPLRVRLLVDEDGGVRVEQSTFTPSREPIVLRLAKTPVQSTDVFLFHKTTRRQVYDERRLPGCDDVVLWNENKEVTETTIANVLADVDGAGVTPPIECGLLAGTCRADLLHRGEVHERRLSIGDLRRAKRLWVTNGVQGRRSAVLLDD